MGMGKSKKQVKAQKVVRRKSLPRKHTQQYYVHKAWEETEAKEVEITSRIERQRRHQISRGSLRCE